MIGIETLKVYLMYMERKMAHHKIDINKSAAENLAECCWISLQIDKVSNMIEYLEDCFY
jgi:hypothetical protein